MRGRKPTSNFLKLVSGNPGKRRIKPEPVIAAAAPEPPAYLCAAALAVWHELVPLLAAANIVTPLDRTLLGCYCSTAARIADAEQHLADGMLVKTPTGFDRPSPWFQILTQSTAQLLTLSDLFGLSPLARTRLKVQAQPVSDAFDRYLARGRDKSPVNPPDDSA